MKKVLFLSLILAVGMTGYAQKNQVVKAGKNKCMKLEQYKAFGKETSETSSFTPNAGVPATVHHGSKYESRADFEVMVTQMDLQANSFVANRMWRFDDGSVGVVATFPDNGTGRGTGYNFYNGEEFGDQPETRIESVKTGWPTYCQYGQDGEIVVAHTGSGLVYYTRATKGEGEWEGPKEIPNPNLGLPDENLTWPRVVTSGPNHDIIHVISASQDDDAITYNFYSRSTDGENWTTTRIPTFGERERFTADDYALASNGNTVAMLFCGNFEMNAFILKSDDNGLNWERTTIWDNPYSDIVWDETTPIFDDEHPMYCPENGAICIDNNGMVHCAFSTAYIAHWDANGDGVGTYVYSGLTASEGIFYWNENMGTLKAPEWTCPEDGYVFPADPHNVFRMWYPTDESAEYVRRNFDQPLIGFVDPAAAQNWSNDSFHHDDYYTHWMGCSATPAICVDDNGIVAVAYSVVDPTRIDASTNRYQRSVFVSYIEAPYVIGDAYYDADAPEYSYTDYPGNFYYNEENFQNVDDEDWGFFHSMDEAVYVNSIQNTVNKEFWFSFQADQQVGLFVGNTHYQNSASDNIIWVVKVVPDQVDGIDEQEAINPMTNVLVYPNPTTDVLNIEVNASQSSDMNIAVFNITGQKVMEKNVNINTGINKPSISTTGLSSGIYFVTVKANGFENTMKFIVK